jgi:hypothetical protein
VGVSSGTNGAQFASQYLRQLLTQPGPYRRAWQRYAFRWRGGTGQLNQSAVAQVLARHIWEAGDDDDHLALPRGLKDRIARALRGEVLSPRTLRLFVDAFGFTDAEQNRPWLLLGTPVYEAPYVLASYPEAGYRTLLLHEFCFVGPDGLAREQRTIEVIRAVEPGVDRCSVPVDVDASAIEVVRGGRAAPLAMGESPATVDIEFGHVLEPGETASFEYRVLLGGRVSRPPMFRRSAVRRIDNVELRVQFDARRLPSSVTWNAWRGVDGQLRSQQPVVLDDDCSAHRYLPRLEASTVGFCWKW